MKTENRKTVHVPQCECDTILDYRLRVFSNNTLHVYAYCSNCGMMAQSAVKRESIPLSKWKALIADHKDREN